MALPSNVRGINPDSGYQDIGSASPGQSSFAASGGVAYWGDAPEQYDTVVVAGFSLPGLCNVKGKGYEMRRRHQKASGKHGASTTFLGNEPAEFVITVMMTEETHLRDFEKLVALFKPSAKPSPEEEEFLAQSSAFTAAFTGQAGGGGGTHHGLKNAVLQDKASPGFVSVSHPLLALFRISHARIIRVTIPVQAEDKGMWHSEIHCIEEVLDGSRKAKTGKTGDAGNIAPRVTAYDDELNRGPAAGTPESPPSTDNAGPPP